MVPDQEQSSVLEQTGSLLTSLINLNFNYTRVFCLSELLNVELALAANSLILSLNLNCL